MSQSLFRLFVVAMIRPRSARGMFDRHRKETAFNADSLNERKGEKRRF